MHRSYLADIERGKRNVTVRMLAELAAALGVSVGQLFPGDEAGPAAVGQVMLVEADATAAEAAVQRLRRARLGSRVTIFRDGQAALDALFGAADAGAGEGRLPRLILVANDLPGLTVADFLERVQGDRRSREIPVIVLRGAAKGRVLATARRRSGAPADPLPPGRSERSTRRNRGG